VPTEDLTGEVYRRSGLNGCKPKINNFSTGYSQRVADAGIDVARKSRSALTRLRVWINIPTYRFTISIRTLRREVCQKSFKHFLG
jgi:hypothetical protein